MSPGVAARAFLVPLATSKYGLAGVAGARVGHAVSLAVGDVGDVSLSVMLGLGGVSGESGGFPAAAACRCVFGWASDLDGL